MELSMWLDKKFGITQKGSNVKTEILGGLLLFAVTIYALPTNAGMFSGEGVELVSWGAMYYAAAIGSFIGTLFLVKANVPIAQLPGMGLNAYVIYTLCIIMGLSFPNAIFLVNLEGLLFIINAKTGLRKKMFHAIPGGVLKGVSVGLGAFLFLVAFATAGHISVSASTGWAMSSWNLLDGNATWATNMPKLVFLITLFSIIIMSEGIKDKNGDFVKKPVRTAVIICMIGGTILYYLLGLTVPGFYESLTVNIVSPASALTDWIQQCAFIGLREGWDFSAYIASHGLLSCIIMIVVQTIGLNLCDTYDTNGTALGCAEAGGQMKLDANGEPYYDKMDDVMAADAYGTEFGALAGCSPVTSYAESAAAFAFGAKTGLAALVAALCYLVAMLLTPIASLIPNVVYTAPLAYVGILLIRGNENRKLDWHKDLPTAVGGILTVVMMPITYNISYGIAWGLFGYVVTYLAQKVILSRLAKSAEAELSRLRGPSSRADLVAKNATKERLVAIKAVQSKQVKLDWMTYGLTILFMVFFLVTH